MRRSKGRLAIGLAVAALLMAASTQSAWAQAAGQPRAEQAPGRPSAPPEGSPSVPVPRAAPVPAQAPAAGPASVQGSGGAEAQSADEAKTPAPAQAPAEAEGATPEPAQASATSPAPVRAQGAPQAYAFWPAQEARRDEGPPLPRVRGDAGSAMAVAVGIDAVWNSDSSYDLFAEDDMAPRFVLWLGYDVFSLTPRLILAAELGGAVGSDDASSAYGSIDASLRTVSAYAGGNLRYVPLPWLQQHLRVAAGAWFVDAEINQTQSWVEPQRFEQEAVSPFASAGVGLTVRTPTRLFETREGHFASLSLGLMVEGGYTFAQSVSFSLSLPEEDDNSIQTRTPELGELEQSGPYVRTSLVVRF